MEDDDDYWNTSETKERALNFDDDILSPQQILAIGQTSSRPGEDIFSNANIGTVKAPLLPILSLVTPKVLELILQAQSGKDPSTVKQETSQTVANSLKRLTLGRPCTLHCHRSLKSKTELLDGACVIGDGDAVLTVVLFLIQTLNRKLVYELLSSRPLALNQYISFLQNEGKIGELTDLLTMLGRSPEAAMYQYQHQIKSQGDNVDVLLRKMGNLMSNHFDQPGVDTHQCKIVADYIKLLEWQKQVSKPELHNRPALRCLSHCLATGNTTHIQTLCARLQISPLQYDWVALNVHAKCQKWDLVESLFTKKDWFGRTTLATAIPLETLLDRLSCLQASKLVLAACVMRAPAADDRLRLALQYKIHSVVIETYAKQKDRGALANYKMTLSPQSEEYILAENTLRDMSIKWKN